MSLCFYVYYRIDPTRVEPARSAAQEVLTEMQAGLCRRARLMTSLDEPLLWLEAYEEVPDRTDFERALAAAVRRHGLDLCLAAGQRRHTEVFAPACV